MAPDEDLIGLIVLTPSGPLHCHWGRIKPQSQVKRYQRRQSLRAVYICNILFGSLVSICRENDNIPVFPQGTFGAESNTSTNASVRMQQVQDLPVFPLDILFQLLPSNRESFEETFHGRCCTLLSRDDMCAFQLPRCFKFQSIRLWYLVSLGSDDTEFGECAKRRKRFASKPKRLKSRKVIERGEFRGVMFKCCSTIIENNPNQPQIIRR